MFLVVVDDDLEGEVLDVDVDVGRRIVVDEADLGRFWGRCEVEEEGDIVVVVDEDVGFLFLGAFPPTW